jgi:hypothetical protein
MDQVRETEIVSGQQWIGAHLQRKSHEPRRAVPSGRYRKAPVLAGAFLVACAMMLSSSD